MLYIKQITVLRFLAALLVIVVHFGQHLPIFQNDLIARFIQEGAIVISFFFFLSGMVLGLNYLPKPQFNGKQFYLKRIARVYPLYSLAFVLTLVLGMYFNNAYPKGYSIVLQFLSLHAWFPGISLEINFPAWTVAVEVFCYLLFPLLLRWFKGLSKKRKYTWALLFWALSALQHILLSDALYRPDELWAGEFILYFPLWHLNCFLFGLLCADFVLDEYQTHTYSKITYRTVYLIGIGVFFTLQLTDNPIIAYAHNGLIAPLYFVILAGLSLDRSHFTQILSHKVLVLLGNSSYALYILQWPIFILVSAYFQQDTLNTRQFSFYFLTLLGVSLLIHTFYENKLRNLLVAKWTKA